MVNLHIIFIEDAMSKRARSIAAPTDGEEKLRKIQNTTAAATTSKGEAAADQTFSWFHIIGFHPDI
jgi:hypothetical protein